MAPDEIFELLDSCIDPAEHDPPEQRAVFIALAEHLLGFADDAIEAM
jgi:hypothetical protein